MGRANARNDRLLRLRTKIAQNEAENRVLMDEIRSISAENRVDAPTREAVEPLILRVLDRKRAPITQTELWKSVQGLGSPVGRTRIMQIAQEMAENGRINAQRGANNRLQYGRVEIPELARAASSNDGDFEWKNPYEELDFASRMRAYSQLALLEEDEANGR